MQVIQCLYKIGICTLPTAYLVQFPGIGTVPATYYYHCINFGSDFFCLGLSFLGCVTDRIHNTNIITFFFEKFQQVLEIYCS